MNLTSNKHCGLQAFLKDDSGKEIYQIVIGSGGASETAWRLPHDEGLELVPEYSDSRYYGYVLVIINGNNVTA